MKTFLIFYSQKENEIKRFLEKYNSKNLNINIELSYKIEFDNPIDMIELITCFTDNKDNYDINLWVSLDNNVYINITKHNINEFVKYLYERYPY